MGNTSTGGTEGSRSTESTPSFFIGVWGDNVIHGTGATEVFFAPGGNEVLTGGGTRDVFIVDSTTRHMEITNFNPAQDVLYIGASSGDTSLQDLVSGAHATAAGLEIDFSGGAVVVLDGVTTPSALTATDTAFFKGAFTPPAQAAPTTTLSSLTPTAPSFFIGKWGDNVIHGTGATEVFFAPGGHEVLTGGGTRDVFIVDSTTQRMEIANFNPAQDVLYIGTSSGAASLQTLAAGVHVTAAGLEIDFARGGVVVLDGITSTSALTTSDTAFFQGAYTPPSASTETTTPTTTAHPPVVTPHPVTLTAGQSVAVSSLETTSDPNGTAISRYYIFDPSHGIRLGGATNLLGTADQAKGYFEVSGADLAKLTYLAGNPGTVNLQIMADDGAAKSAWVQEAITVVSSTGTSGAAKPLVGAANANLNTNAWIPAASLYAASAAGGATIAQVKFTDIGQGGTFFDLNGQVVDNGSITLAPSQVSGLHLDAGTSAGAYSFQVSVQDSNGLWSDAATGHVSVHTPLIGIAG